MIMASSINIITWNVKGLNNPIKRKKVLTHLKNKNADIVFIQETHLKTSDSSRLKSGWEGQFFHSSFQKKARGTAILIHKRIPFTASSVLADPSGRYVIVIGTLFHLNVILSNIYAPNYDDPLFFSQVFGRISCLNSHLLIVGGDFNLCMNPGLDRSSKKNWLHCI